MHAMLVRGTSAPVLRGQRQMLSVLHRFMNTYIADHEDLMAPNEDSHIIKVRAFLASRPKFDNRKFVKKYYGSQISFTNYKMIMVSLENEDNKDIPSNINSEMPESSIFNSPIKKLSYEFNPLAPYFIVFGYGSIVFFNTTEEQRNQCLANSVAFTAQVAKQTFQTPEQAMKKLPQDHYTIIVNPHLDPGSVFLKASTVTTDNIDFNFICVASQALAQSVVMEHYEMLTSQLLLQFREYNLKLEKTGSIQVDNQSLIKALAMNNGVIADVLTYISMLHRSEIVWNTNDPKLETLWNGLRTEFEALDRFETLESKLEVMRDNASFFLDVLNSSKSHHLEWIIIILIVIEVILGLWDFWDRAKWDSTHAQLEKKLERDDLHTEERKCPRKHKKSTDSA